MEAMKRHRPRQFDVAALFAKVNLALAEYKELAAAYDGELQAAHDAHHGTPAFMTHLKAANSMAPEMTEALKRYYSAVAEVWASSPARLK